jgi:hypothetical protein
VGASTQSVARRWRVLRRVTTKLVVIVLRLLPGLPIQGQHAPANRTVAFGREWCFSTKQ